jgi:hypothetical protein
MLARILSNDVNESKGILSGICQVTFLAYELRPPGKLGGRCNNNRKEFPESKFFYDEEPWERTTKIDFNEFKDAIGRFTDEGIIKITVKHYAHDRIEISGNGLRVYLYNAAATANKDTVTQAKAMGAAQEFLTLGIKNATDVASAIASTSPSSLCSFCLSMDETMPLLLDFKASGGARLRTRHCPL